MDMELKAKNKVLEELIQMMEERELGELKSKSPKFAQTSIESNDPDLMEEIKEKLMGDESEEESKVDDSEEFSMEPKEDEESEDDLERLKALYSKLN